MPTYEVTSPNGEVFEVTAPEGASEQEVLSYAQSQFSQPEAQQKPQPIKVSDEIDLGRYGSPLQRGQALTRGALDMATFGFFDELEGAGIGAVRPDMTMQQGIEASRAQDEYLQELYSKTYTTGQVAGALLPASPIIKGGMNVPKGIGYGIAQGGLYGLGTGEGSAEERLDEAAVGGTFGALGGAGGVLAGRQLGRVAQTKPVLGLKERVQKAFFKEKALPAPQKTLPQLNKVSKSGDDVFSMTVGQKTQLPDAQRLEADALAGLYGDDAERAIRQAQIAQSRERKEFLTQLGRLDDDLNANDVLDDVFDTIKKQSKSLKGEVNSAYALAREGGGTKISVNDIKDGLFSNIVNLKREGQFDLNSLPLANKRTNELAKLVRSSKGGRFTEASLSSLENWRKRVTNSINSSQDKTEKLFLGKILDNYDDFMYKTANEAVDANDEAAILAFRDAVRKRREYGKLYESDAFVKKLISGEMSVDDAVKNLIGTGSIKGKKSMERTYDAVVKAAGKEADTVKRDLQTAFAKKLLDQSISGLETGGEAAYLSAAKTKTALEGLFINNKNFAEKLYGKESVSVARKAISELDKIATTQIGTQNPSGSGQLILRSLMRLPFMGALREGTDFVIVKPMKTAKVQKAVDPVVSQIKSMKVTPQSSFFAGAGAKLMAEQGVNE